MNLSRAFWEDATVDKSPDTFDAFARSSQESYRRKVVQLDIGSGSEAALPYNWFFLEQPHVQNDTLIMLQNLTTTLLFYLVDVVTYVISRYV